jgi:signal transduction histidine kinase
VNVLAHGNGNGAAASGGGHGGARPEATAAVPRLPSPFRREGLPTRIAPFAVVAALAELSLALPPGPLSAPAAALSVALLALTAAAVLLPWPRLPAWATVLVPLLYTAAVLALMVAAGGADSGTGVVLLTPLIWTALFHRPWESGCVVAAILIVVLTVSLEPDDAPAVVILRRLLFWGLLTVMIAVATHSLRDRIRQSQEAADRLQANLREASILQDRDRIASCLQDTVVQRLFTAGMSLQSIRSLTGAPQVSARIDAVIHNLDEAIKLLRQSIFGLEHGLPALGLRRSILDVSNELTPALGLVPEVTLDGPIDTGVPPMVAAQLLVTLRETLGASGAAARATRVEVAVTARGDTVSLAVTDNGTRWAARTCADGPRLDTLRERARRLGGTAEVTAGEAGSSVLTWRVPLATAPAAAGPRRR